ncbi:MAG: hypothetical protein GWN31_15225 [Candidatus Thorarchaeota archaeon]|nr:hypothetical protein [Candidatus Thorarchaeota archaeon]NIW15242.1 hypothetical protein [Candidatus Thorarchaeota archaeon]NIW53219.1 hypothetical protein [Candidatus Korarchaeota archaeon]
MNFKKEGETLARNFSPEKDYRLALAVWATNQLSDLEKKGGIPGVRKREGLKILEKMDSCLLNLRESNFSKQQLLQSPAFAGFSDLLSTFMSKLGNNWFRIAYMKDPYAAKLLRFGLFNLRSLGIRLRKADDEAPASAVRIRCSRILKIEDLKGLDEYFAVSATDMEIKYDLAIKKSYNVKQGDTYVLSHLPPKKIGQLVSEAIFLRKSDTLLKGTPGNIGKRPSEIPEEALGETNERVIDLLEKNFLL